MACHSSHPGGTSVGSSRPYPFMNLPTCAVRYPARRSHVGSQLEVPRSRCQPPIGGPLVSTPLLCEYWPVRKVAREGQQRGLLTNEFANVVPAPPIRALVRGMACIDRAV